MRRRLCLYALLAACGAAGCSSTREAPPTVTGSTPTHSRFAKKAFNRPYEIKGITYKPKAHYEHVEEGIASYYGGGGVFHVKPPRVKSLICMKFRQPISICHCPALSESQT